MITTTKNAGAEIESFTETTSEEEMDRVLEARHDEIVAMLDEAYAQKERGEFRELEPFHVFLQRAHARQNASK
jgi:hypothetical protein